MLVPKVLALGKFAPDHLQITQSVSTRAIDPGVETQLEALWQTKLAKALEQGKHIYNGLSYRLNAFVQEGNTLKLDLGIIEYKVRDGLIDIPEYYDLPEPFYRKGCYTTATVKTSDDLYLLAELSGKSMNLNTIEMLGGIMETDPPVQVGRDVFGSLFKELEEEALVMPSDISEAYLRALFLECRTNIALYFEVILNVSSEEIFARFQKESKDADIKQLKAHTRTEYLEALHTHNANKQLMTELLSI